MFNYFYETLTSPEHLSRIAKRLHDERIRANLTLDKLAEKLNYTKPTVHSWERGWDTASGYNRLPSIEQLYALANLYECTPEYLLCEYEGRSHELTDIAKETGLTESSIKLLHEYFDTYKLNPSYNGGTDMYLAFINFFIENMHDFEILFFRRRQLAYRTLEFQYDKYRDTILKAHAEIFPVIRNLPTNDFLYGNLAYKAIEDYYTAAGYEGWERDALIAKHYNSLDILTPTEMKQSDFEISDTFLDMVKDFFSNIDNTLSEYTDYFDNYVDPAFINPPPVITELPD